MATDVEDLMEHMNSKEGKIISLSKRTDVCFYINFYLQCFKQGYIDLTYPSHRHILLDPHNVKVIVWWSKNYGPILPHLSKELKHYDHYFHFTINSECPLEPNVPPLKERLKQLRKLAKKFGHESITLRFDPIIRYKINKDKKWTDNLNQFEEIVAYASKYDIDKVTINFCKINEYPKVVRRIQNSDFELDQISNRRRIKIINNLCTITQKYNVKIMICAEYMKTYNDNIEDGACIDGKLFNVKGKNPTRPGCKCCSSIDIGSYNQVCGHKCLYCYASR